MNAPDLSQAREVSRRNVELFSRERSCLADLLLSLAEFDRGLLHRALGYSGLFDYLQRELGMSKGMAHYRLVATRLVQRFPAVVQPIRDGRLCITTVIELARVLTEENCAEVLPRFLGLSREEARQVAAEIRPAEVVPRRTVVTMDAPLVGSTVELDLTHPEGGERPVEPARPPLLPSERTTRTRVEPFTSTETRLHITVSPAFVTLLRKAKAGESHRNPWATDEQVLTAALELLVERQAKRRASVPAKVKREVLKRDQGKCQWKLAGGGICGATVRLEVDHVVPRGRGGPDTVKNARLLCKAHNLEAARQAYGDEIMDRFAPRTSAEGRAVQQPDAREPAASYGSAHSPPSPPLAPLRPPLGRPAREGARGRPTPQHPLRPGGVPPDP